MKKILVTLMSMILALSQISTMSYAKHFYGSGDDNELYFNTSKKYVYVVESYNCGESNFSVKSYNQRGKYDDLLVNTIGDYSGISVLWNGEKKKQTNASLTVTSNGDWDVEVRRLKGTMKKKIKGKGDYVTGFFTGTGKKIKFEFTNTGKSNFAVVIYSTKNGYEDLLVNEIGNYADYINFKTKKGVKYFLGITSSGKWTCKRKNVTKSNKNDKQIDIETTGGLSQSM